MGFHVVTALDGSDTSTDVFEFAIDQFPDASHTLLHVLDPPATGYRTGDEAGADLPDSEFNRNVERETAFLEPLQEQAASAGIQAETDHAIAYTRYKEARAIIHYATEHEADLIVVGSRGDRTLSRVLLGSVAETVVRRAPQSVLVVRSDD